jgi:uncharacterized protein (DUF1810 family)
MAEPFDLERFVVAQAAVMDDVRRELRAGRKRTHWMWFVFPQLRALGRSPTAQRYGIASLAEAQAFMAHAVLGPRLIECAGLVRAIGGRSAQEVFGSPDDMKLHSSMTLFAAARPDEAVFADVIRHYFAGQPDPLTTELLKRG